MWEVQIKEVVDSWNSINISCVSLEEAEERAHDFAQKFAEVCVLQGGRVLLRYVGGRLQKKE